MFGTRERAKRIQHGNKPSHSCIVSSLPQMLAQLGGSLEQCLFNKKLPSKFTKFYLLWSLIRGVTLWSIWLERNDLNFNGARWPHNKLKKVMWDGLLNYSRLEWQHTLQKIKRKLTNEASLLEALIRCGVQTMSSVLRTGVKLGGAINHLTSSSFLWQVCGSWCPGRLPWPCGVLVLFLQWISHLC